MPGTVEPVLAPGALAGFDQPVLSCAELVIRPWQPTDVAVIVGAYAEPDIQRWHAQSMNAREAEAWIRSRSERWHREQGADWAVTDGTGVLGRIGLTQMNFHYGLGEVTYWVLPVARGRGVAARALCAMTDWAFHRVGFHRLEVTHSTDNPRSCRVADRAGFALEGTMRGQARHADGWHDMHLHARLAGDPQPDPTKRLL
ncbi:MAG: GNAT family N-acetyltransferase [Solirubrobacteraceae bacterium]